MAISNSERIGRGLEVLRTGLAPFIEQEMKAVHGSSWHDFAKQSCFKDNDWKVVDGKVQWEVYLILMVIWDQWNTVFSKTLGPVERSYVSELRDVRKRWAHQQPFSYDDTYRALDTMSRLLKAVSAAEAEEITRMAQETMRVRIEEQVRTQTRRKSSVPVEGTPMGGLKPWREIVMPHPDVASGRYQQAEFAADLDAVRRGVASSEYGDPREFFRRTYLTIGLTDLLKDALLRLTNQGGAPVIELQTNFGGGKTHSMLALYHLFSGVSAKDLADVEMLLQTTGVPQAPKACRAVLVGTALSPGIPHTKPDGTIIHTLWGELAWQLGGQKGYALVANNDANGSSPGSVILSELFKMCSPCLILIDEWVAYARQTYGKIDLPGGSFDSNMTFAQAITEATRATPGTMLVASIPASQIEIGGEGGREALARIQNTFSRMESPWRPASAEESYEIVRRRLFEPIADPELFATRDAVIRAFGQAYRQAGSDFPQGVDEADYQRRMTNAYPIHPELFDRLYEDWSSLERFQRTRGVLRLMASVISELWERQDSSLLILPASIPMDAPVVQSELTRYLEDNWRPIMEQDVDGPEAVPLRIDRDVPTLGRYSATRRVARTIFLGSAPTVKSKNPGIDDRRVKLGCFQPGENVATFGDALRRLTGSKARHLYVDGSRYWFSTQPSVTGLADDRAAQISIDDVWEELKTRLRSDRQRGEFAAVHVTPASSGDVPDEMEARMVILGPTQRHTSKAKDSQALNSASEILNARGSSPRFYKNMLVFLAPDQARLNDLEEAIRQYLAWNSIWEHRETLNLDAFQSSLARTRREQATKTVDSRILETYFWLLYPGQPDPQGPVEWQESRLQGLEPLAVRASRKLVNDGNLMNQFSAINLRLELDRCNLWKDVDHLSVKKLWEYFASYIYLPRLTGSGVLTKAIQEGVALVTWSEAFVYAERWDESACRYLGLKIGQHTSVILDGQSVIVKPSAAKAQLEAEKKPSVQPPGTAQPGGTGGTQPGPSPIPIPGGGGVTITIEPTKSIAPRRFYASVKLDPMRISGNAGKIAEEVVQHLSSLLGANVDVTLEIQVKVPEGVPENIVRTVTENCRTLKFSQYGFEEE